MRFPKLSREQLQQIKSKQSFKKEMELNQIERSIVASQVWHISLMESIVPDVASIVYITGIPKTKKYEPLTVADPKAICHAMVPAEFAGDMSKADVSVSAESYREWLNRVNPMSLEMLFRIAMYVGLAHTLPNCDKYQTGIVGFDFKSLGAYGKLKQFMMENIKFITVEDYEALYNLVMGTDALELIKLLAKCDFERFARYVRRDNGFMPVEEIANFVKQVKDGSITTDEISLDEVSESNSTERIHDYCPLCGALLNGNGICVNMLCNYVKDITA